MAAITIHYAKRVITETNATIAHNSITQKMDFTKRLIIALEKEILASVGIMAKTGYIYQVLKSLIFFSESYCNPNWATGCDVTGVCWCKNGFIIKGLFRYCVLSNTIGRGQGQWACINVLVAKLTWKSVELGPLHVLGILAYIVQM